MVTGVRNRPGVFCFIGGKGEINVFLMMSKLLFGSYFLVGQVGFFCGWYRGKVMYFGIYGHDACMLVLQSG